MKKLCLAFMVVVLSVVSSAVAQQGGPGSSPAQAAMERVSQIFGKQAFSAKVVMTMATSDGKSAMPAPMEFSVAMSQGKSRMEMDMSRMTEAAGKRAGAQQGGMPAGLGQMVTISRPDKKVRRR